MMFCFYRHNFIKNFPLQVSKITFFLFEYNFKMLIFIVYVFFLGVYLFYDFLTYKFVVWIYDLYMLGFV
jgi:hypothetical protein